MARKRKPRLRLVSNYVPPVSGKLESTCDPSASVVICAAGLFGKMEMPKILATEDFDYDVFFALPEILCSLNEVRQFGGLSGLAAKVGCDEATLQNMLVALEDRHHVILKSLRIAFGIPAPGDVRDVVGS